MLSRISSTRLPASTTLSVASSGCSTGAGALGFAHLFLQRGYDVLTPDSRAHGGSEGGFASYGAREVDDLQRWTEWLARERATTCICGLGESMGAAILLQALPSTPRIHAAVAESSFASLREIGYDRIGQMFGTGPWLGRTLLRPILETGLLYGRVRYEVPLADVSPEEAIAKTHIPVLLIHGAADDNIPPAHSARLLRRAGANVTLWQPANTGHIGAIARWPAEFERRVLEVFSRGCGPS